MTSCIANASTIYVDNTLGGNCSGDYSISEQACSGSDGNAYTTIQAAINAMSAGDTIYIRGGTYREGPATNEDINIPVEKNGSAWTEGNYNTLASYPGEWAIIDGEGTAPGGIVIGNAQVKGIYQSCDDDNSTTELKYWKFERLGITGGTLPGNSTYGGAGLFLRGGPFIIRYCHIYDNWDDAYNGNPAGITAYVLHDSTIEYNYFYHNGYSSTNGAQIDIFTDYKDEWRSSPVAENCDPANIDVINLDGAVRNNIIRYNYFDGGDGTNSEVAIKYKASQVLDSWDGSEWTNETYGDEIHHNIIVDHSGYGVILRQDYLQFYKNIIVGESLSQSQYGGFRRLRTTAYNNTIIGAGIESWDETDTDLDTAGSQAHPFQNWDYFYNNIIDNFSSGTSTYAVRIFAEAAASLDNVTNNLVMDRNYIYRPNDNAAEPYSVGIPLDGLDAAYGHFSTADFNTQYSTTNYQKTTSEGSDNLFSGASGADQYITRGAHIISGATTIADGGLNAAHPYLAGVTIPAYVGATNPTDYAWVEGVLSMDSTWFASQTGGSTPSWIEGGTYIGSSNAKSAMIGNSGGAAMIGNSGGMAIR